MASLLSLAALAGTAVAAFPKVTRQVDGVNGTSINATTTVSNVTLVPITLPGIVTTEEALAPASNFTVSYGVNETNFVNITFTTESGAVVLEDIDTLTAVDCAVDTVSLTFATVADLAAAYASWSAYDQLVLITNHLGNCDPEVERGFFLAGDFTILPANNTLLASAERCNVSDVAYRMTANFTGLPATQADSTTTLKRDIVIDPADVTVATEWDLPSLTLYEYDPYVTATAESGSLGISVTLGGYLEFDIWTFSLDALYVDVEANTTADLVLGLEVSAPYDDTFSYSNGVAYYVVDVPGILTFGPEVSFEVGAELAVDAAVDIVVDVGADIQNATLHLDFVGDATAADNWTPIYHANVTFTEEASIAVTPFLSVTVGLEFEVLGGLLDLSGGLTPSVRFPVSVDLEAEQEVGVSTSTNVTVSIPSDNGTCANGLEVQSDFEFLLDAFVTEFFSVTLYNVTVPIADECYSWA